MSIHNSGDLILPSGNIGLKGRSPCEQGLAVASHHPNVFIHEESLLARMHTQKSLLAICRKEQSTVADSRVPMNFKVGVDFHKAYKLVALQHGLSMRKLLALGLRLSIE